MQLEIGLDAPKICNYFYIEDKEHSDAPKKFKDEELEALLSED